MRRSPLLRLIVVGMAVLYVGLLIGFTVAFVDDVPTAAWVGLGVVATVVTALAIGTVLLFERIDARAGLDGRADAPPMTDGRYRLLVVADVGCEGTIACPLIVAQARSGGSNARGRRFDEILSLLKTKRS